MILHRTVAVGVPICNDIGQLEHIAVCRQRITVVKSWAKVLLAFGFIYEPALKLTV